MLQLHLNQQEKDLYAHQMEVYAAYLSFVDHYVGELVAYLDEIGQLDNTLIIAVSESTKQDLVDAYGVAPERVRVVPLGISPPATPPAPASALNELGLNGTFVLQVGRVETRKNQAAALAAVERLNGVTLVIAGPERDRALWAALQA